MIIETNKPIWVFIAFFAALFSILRTGTALNCYECNSYKDGPGCLKKELLKNFSVPCNNKADENAYVACRKITQTIDFEVNGLPPDSRVIRSCAYQRQEINKCYQRSGFGGRQEVCACDSDNCNNSNDTKFNLGLLFISSAFLAYSYKHLVQL